MVRPSELDIFAIYNEFKESIQSKRTELRRLLSVEFRKVRHGSVIIGDIKRNNKIITLIDEITGVLEENIRTMERIATSKRQTWAKTSDGQTLLKVLYFTISHCKFQVKHVKSMFNCIIEPEARVEEVMQRTRLRTHVKDIIFLKDVFAFQTQDMFELYNSKSDKPIEFTMNHIRDKDKEGDYKEEYKDVIRDIISVLLHCLQFEIETIKNLLNDIIDK
jgi:hypothetical protein